MTRKRKVPWNRELFGCRSLDFRTFSIIREHAHVLGRVALLRQRFQDIRQLLRRGLSPACRMNCNRRKSSLWRVTPIPGLIREIHAASESFQYNAPIGRGNCNRTLMTNTAYIQMISPLVMDAAIQTRLTFVFSRFPPWIVFYNVTRRVLGRPAGHRDSPAMNRDRHYVH